MVRSIQQPCEHLVRNRRSQKIPADVPALENRPIHRLPLKQRELLARIGSTLSDAGRLR